MESSLISSSSSSAADAAVFNPHHSRFQTPDGAAFLTYRLLSSSSDGRQGTLDLQHTYVPPSKRGSGVAAILCKAAFDYAKEHNLRVIPTCSYVSDTFLPRNPGLKYLTEKNVAVSGL